MGQSDKADKPYLIGVFGQGGSSAFSVSEYSVIVSRRAPEIREGGGDGGAGWSIVRAIQPRGRRDHYYAYLAASEHGGVPSVDAAAADKAGFTNGAHFCHINYDFGGSEFAVTRLLYQALNHVLFNPILPYDLYALKDSPSRCSARRSALRVTSAPRAAGGPRQVLRGAAGGDRRASWPKQQSKPSSPSSTTSPSPILARSRSA